MARLRKPSPDEPIYRPSTTTRPTRSSPRKPARSVQYTESSDEENIVLVPKRSTLDLRNDSLSQDADESFFTSRSIMSTDLTPRKQRILRPMESNSRLLRKISDESLASPEKRRRERRERIRAAEDHIGAKSRQLYAKTLAKSMTKKSMSCTKTDVVTDAVLRDIPFKSVEEDDTQMNDVHEDVETSLWCGDAEEQEEKDSTPQEEISDEEDDDPVVSTRQSRQRPQARRVVSESDSDDSFETPQSEFAHSSSGRSGTQTMPRAIKIEPAQENIQPLRSMRPPHRKGHSTISNWAQEVIDLTSSPDPTPSFIPPALPESTRMRSASFASSRPETSSSSHGGLAILTYSPTPTKRRSPCKAPPIARPGTPPLAPPSPTKLVSPSKKKPTIPKAPNLRPSLDAFWDPEVVNSHNDLHSPSKPLVSPRKQKWRDDIVKMMEGITLDDEEDNELADPPSPTTSPRKKTTAEPTKPSKSTKKPGPTSVPNDPSIKAVRAQRKAFAAEKDSLATSFLTQLDETITSGQISTLCASTGGIKLIWSSTLKTTAGRANWRREQIRLRTGPLATDIQTTIRHHCSIELATKVIDDSTRLYNVLAHEFCHLATFMISGVRNNPHGKEFKSWGAKCSAAFAHLDVEVTTKHSYAIDYKFVWECVECGYEFKRHSKSVDVARHSCGKCKGRLVQTKPTPRQGGGQSGYQAFVKENYKRVKEEMEKRGEETGMAKVVERVAREYREMKEREGKKVESGDRGAALEDVMGELKI
ncbi:hypothetical protein IQ06DRAFT_276222 [Phaeosphaeriaceae sp. SRC1lsM3a]|nr:hypothetical protein IQ06DRAFT_276222 [Stagonospora sp. SRC1lsM3a]